MERQQYVERCSELFAVGGYEAVRAAAEAGLEECGPDAVLYRWLGQAHAAEDEEDHDREAEAAYRKGLALAADDLGLLVSYLELCLRSDSFDHPGRARRAVALQERIEELAPPGSTERRRVDDATGWAGRGYWDDLNVAVVQGQAQQAATAEQSVLVTDALRRAARGEAEEDTGEDLQAAELAAAVELLQGARNAPLRLILAHRVEAYVLTFVASFGLNKALVWSGVLDFSLWGWLFWVPMLVAEAKLRRAKKLGQERVIARIQARHDETRLHSQPENKHL
ncbi:hypothetical protein E5083_07575 [Streptomyces bauhiniae]|uniref:Tetratricopeptide repeat protein n=1 Tax=Streptomyces bauhiniae TaxID=2340725 RepID=A0A4Z1D9W0_9ACTN|nr:hypothetical protein [Streptomyces bauhiniae]TGN79477.1 hypothetical protein E5083_07575 [Streptomyces bauhiniae]